MDGEASEGGQRERLGEVGRGWERLDGDWRSENGEEKVEARVVERSVDSTCLESCTKSATNMPRNHLRPLPISSAEPRAPVLAGR